MDAQERADAHAPMREVRQLIGMGEGGLNGVGGGSATADGAAMVRRSIHRLMEVTSAIGVEAAEAAVDAARNSWKDNLSTLHVARTH